MSRKNQRAKAGRKGDFSSLVRRHPQSDVIARLRKVFGGEPNCQAIGRTLGFTGEAVRQVIHLEYPWPNVQEALADLVGTSVVELFGDAAWPRVAARKLEAAMERERRAG